MSNGLSSRWVRLLPWFALSLLVIGLDQWSKWVVVENMDLQDIYPVIEGCFNFVLAYNKGAAFSFLSSAGGWQRHFLSLLAILISGWVVVMIFQSLGQRLTCLALSMILGGAIGNLIDRIRLGAVVDFIDWYVGKKHWPTFNVADIAISVGIFLLLLDALIRLVIDARNRKKAIKTDG